VHIRELNSFSRKILGSGESLIGGLYQTFKARISVKFGESVAGGHQHLLSFETRVIELKGRGVICIPDIANLEALLHA
jgi:hypothetical protein